MKRFKLLSFAVLVVAMMNSVLASAHTGFINVLSREAGSGTRDTFVELVGVVDENGDDATTVEADIQNTTSGIMQTVAGFSQAIGYSSLASMDDSIKAISIDGVEPTNETVRNGEYEIARAFNIVWNEDKLSDLHRDFMKFIYSSQASEIIEEMGYTGVDPLEEGAIEHPTYEVAELSGNISIVGSTSVTPVMEKLGEEYSKLNPGVKIDLTSNGSTAGVNGIIEGTADFGLASRAISEEEQEQVSHAAVALDAIVIVLNKSNDVDKMSLETVQKIFLGEITDWEDVE